METRSRARTSRSPSREREANRERDEEIGAREVVNELAPIAEVGENAEEEPPMVNPMFDEFRQFQLFQAWMEPRVPMPPGQQLGQVRHAVPDVDPGRMVAMSQVKVPVLEGLSAAHIKSFRMAYQRYSARCVVNDWKQKPGSLVTPDHLLVIASRNGILDLDVLRELPEDQFFNRLCAVHHASSTREWHSLITQVRMQTSVCSLEKFVEFSEEFKFQLELAGVEFAPPMSEIVKYFVNGLSPKQFQQEVRLRYFTTLTEAIEEGVQIVVKYKHTWETHANQV
jgi:hypothetical protein